MKNRANMALVAAAGSLALTAASASAGVILTFGFTELNGQYTATDGNSGTLVITAVTNANLQSEGDLTRLLPPGDGTAAYDHGFRGSAFGGLANVVMTLSRVGTSGSGTYTVTDKDGDTLSGSLSGDWIFLGGATFFNGTIGGTFSNAGVSLFDGASVPATSFTPIVGPMDGGVTLLFTNNNADFFGSNFDGVSVLTSANFVPTPGALALVGLGGLVVGRRRR